jgi:hypothetical protein
VGDIGEFQTPRQWDVTKEVDLITATDGSILFGVGYHSWILPQKRRIYYYQEVDPMTAQVNI